MINFSDFRKKYNGKEVDTDGIYPGQCMDLMHQYIVDCLGLDLALFAAPTAYQAYKNANDPRFDKIANTPTGVPQAGDIVFWNTTVGSAGHVAIFIEGDADKFTSFDQNWPTGSLCHEQQHDYKGVAGWLHFKAQAPQVDTQAIIDELRVARDSNWQLYQTELSKNNDLKTQLETEQRKSQELREANDKLTKADADTGAELIDVSHERDSYKSTLEAWAGALGSTIELKSGLEAIEGLRRPIEEQVKPLQKHALTLQDVLDDFIYKRVPQSKGWIERILHWIR